MSKSQLNDAYNDKRSYVAKDQIWKDHVNKSLFSARKWPELWGEVFVEEKSNSQQDQQSSTSNNNRNNKKHLHPPIKPAEDLILSQLESPRPVPKTTSQMIGWRSADRSYHLDKFGPYTKGKFSINKSLNWPADAI